MNINLSAIALYTNSTVFCLLHNLTAVCLSVAMRYDVARLPVERTVARVTTITKLVIYTPRL